MFKRNRYYDYELVQFDIKSLSLPAHPPQKNNKKGKHYASKYPPSSQRQAPILFCILRNTFCKMAGVILLITSWVRSETRNQYTVM